MDKNEETKQTENITYNENDPSVSSFISYLMAAFDCKGINLLYGLKLCLVIFSSDYASSVSCLEKLAKHLKLSRCDKNSYEVVPVFYGVSRLAVKQQSGTLSDAFTKLEMSNSADQVKKWRRALAQVAELQGHEYNDKKSEESEFLEEIVQAVFEKLHPTEEIGIHSRELDIENLLCKQPWGLRTLGISGEPGTGKTVLARAVFRRMARDYDDPRFFENFHAEYSEMKLEPLPDYSLCMTPMEEFHLNDSGSEACHRQKRVLIVLDDVKNAQDAMSFLGAVDQFAPGSLIIITSRDRQVLEECNVNEIYEHTGLNDEDALKLFTRCAFGKDEIGTILLDLSMNVIECCDGNPSTLRSYADKVKGNTKVELEQALLRICYDALMNTKKNTSACLYSNIEEHHEHEEYGVLATKHAKYRFSKKTVLRATQTITFSLEEHTDLDLPPPLGHPAHVQVQSLPQHFHNKQLVLLQRVACQFHKLWQGYNKSFSRLKSINLRHCMKLVQVAELSNARNLEKLDLQDCKSLESIPNTDQLENLQFLNLSGCIGIKYFPETLRTIRELKLDEIEVQAQWRDVPTHNSSN
ncbi:unnamed protein product [Thlaspi arvense]|uniref:TIR domain-containing protein n=1 Tax=Thlaspi arvense TaxID=13288 RepID=A0AAU9RSX9_THLAR|nr:unnamed protein product [Thlaspi arvense]